VGFDEPLESVLHRCLAVLTIPLVGGGDLAGMLELDPGNRDGFPADERELAEVLAVLLTLSLGNAA